MIKVFKYFGFFIIGILCLIIIGRISGIFQIYKVATIANEPNFQMKSIMLASKLVKPKRLDYIWIMGETPPYGRGENLYKLCGLDGDTIELRNGILFVNSKNIDIDLKLSHNYLVANNELNRIKELIDVNADFLQTINIDTISIPLSDDFVSENRIKTIRFAFPKKYKDSLIYTKFNQAWNQDNFGPITVPKNKFFVLGDNRHCAHDSRYKGFIDKEDFSSTVIWKQ